MITRNQEGEPELRVHDWDCGFDRDFYIDHPHLLNEDHHFDELI